MNILYITNMKYAWNVQGTMKSIADEVKSRGHNVHIVDKSKITSLPSLIDQYKPAQIWLSSSDLKIDPSIKARICVPIIGFGFSDPYYFSADRFESYNVYATNHYETFKKYSSIIPTIYNPTACDFRFHKNLKAERSIISMIGTTNHPRFKDPQMRPKIVNKLREDGFIIHCYGDGWPKHPHNHKAITGDAFINIINKSIIGLDLQETYSPLAHRMLEYGACGTPVITRNRPEVNNVLELNTEVITYDDYDSLKSKLQYYLNNKDELMMVGSKAELRCKKSNDIKYRIDHLLNELQKI
jgi:glycosyltransferase involved in cell wall biosynthesis